MARHVCGSVLHICDIILGATSKGVVTVVAIDSMLGFLNNSDLATRFEERAKSTKSSILFSFLTDEGALLFSTDSCRLEAAENLLEADYCRT